MKNSKHILFCSLFMVLFFACEKQTIEDLETKTTVVEAYLHAGQSVDSIKITQSFSYAQVDTNITVLDGLDIILSDSSGQYSLTSVGDGFYQNLDLIVEEDKSYRLEILHEGEKVFAETYVPTKTEAHLSIAEVVIPEIEAGSEPSPPTDTQDPIEISWNNSEGDYYYVVISNIEEEPEYVNGNTATAGGPPRFVFITEPQITDFYAINPRRELTQYGTHEIVVFRVNPEYAALYESSGNSTLSLEQAPTNIENGLGIFTGLSSDTLYFEVSKN